MELPVTGLAASASGDANLAVNVQFILAEQKVNSFENCRLDARFGNMQRDSAAILSG